MQEPFYFGPEDREVFGVYHPALSVDSGILTVICPPLYSEFNRSYAALRNLALALVKRGQHVLRMEYSGTGDSYGDLCEASLFDWTNEISLAVNEGLELSACRRVRVLGVRGSALLVCQALGDRDDLDRLVLWDPAPNGKLYRESLQQEQDHLLNEHLYLDGNDRRAIRKEFDLYRMPESMWRTWPEFDGSVYLKPPTEKLKVVRTPKSHDFALEGVQPTFVDFTINWGIKNGEVFMCQPVLESLLGKLTES